MRIPLSERLRPSSLEDVVGQDHLLDPLGLIANTIKKKTPLSLLFWGPPGCGKTTLAKLYAKAFSARFIALSATSSTTLDLRKIIGEIENNPLFAEHLILFVDEIHRFNKAQQDFFLPYLEKGTFVLLGATTENPSFALNDALLSRMRVLPVSSLQETDLNKILHRFESQVNPLQLTEAARILLISYAQGDARHFLNMLENISYAFSSGEVIDESKLSSLVQKRNPLFDKKGDGHYNLISSLHKAVRGSDPDASLYWFCRILEGGEDPQFIARRIVRMATEDIGLADPQALTLAINAWKAYDQLGSPEGELALAQAIVYLALSPKSNSIYTAYTQAKLSAKKTSHLAPPKIIMNAPTPLMKEMGCGSGYYYDHDAPFAFSGQNYFPDAMDRQEYYCPKEYGFEKELAKRMAFFSKLREQRK